MYTGIFCIKSYKFIKDYYNLVKVIDGNSVLC